MIPVKTGQFHNFTGKVAFMPTHHKRNKVVSRAAERKFFYILIGVAIGLMALMYFMFKATS